MNKFQHGVHLSSFIALHHVRRPVNIYPSARHGPPATHAASCYPLHSWHNVTSDNRCHCLHPFSNPSTGTSWWQNTLTETDANCAGPPDGYEEKALRARVMFCITVRQDSRPSCSIKTQRQAVTDKTTDLPVASNTTSGSHRQDSRPSCSIKTQRQAVTDTTADLPVVSKHNVRQSQTRQQSFL